MIHNSLIYGPDEVRDLGESLGNAMTTSPSPITPVCHSLLPNMTKEYPAVSHVAGSKGVHLPYSYLVEMTTRLKSKVVQRQKPVAEKKMGAKELLQ